MRRYNHIISILLCVVISGFLIVEILFDLTPPISRDALIHHLAIPKLWIEHGGFYEIPWADFSYYPMNIDLLYLVPLCFKNDILPKFMHLAFGFGTGLLVYYYLKNRFGRNWGLLGFLIFFSTPVVVRLSTSAYVDLGMIFFITASVLSFVEWRNGDYEKTRWLILSAVCMGLAAGSKYNALIAWFFLNSVLILYCSRDTKSGPMALKSGAIFLAVAFLVASPWYVKNCILTTNPTYPLFDNFFKVFQHANTNDAGASGIQTIGSLGIFGRREILFGENFWETIFIPIRMFFQGEDGSARYFDGVLNSILICMLPFVFIKNSSGSNREKLLFLSFSAFFFFMAYFSAVIRARYILPVIPFLAILSVMGINNLFGWISEKSRTFRNVGIVGIFAVLTVFLLPNVLYMKNYVDTVRPFGYLLGKETRDEFLTRNVASYAVMRYINENLPRDSKIFLMFTGRRGYYLDRSYYCERSFGMNTAKGIVEASKSKEGLQSYLNSLGCTHILMRADLFDKYLRDNFSNEVIIGFIDEIRKYWKLVCVSNGFAVYAISFNSVGVPSS